MLYSQNVMQTLKWKAKFNTGFQNEENFLETILKEYGVKDIPAFLHPKKEYCHDPFLMKNMKEAVNVFHEIMEMEKPKIVIKVDCD